METAWPSPKNPGSGEELAVSLQCDIKVGVAMDGRARWDMLVVYLQSVPGAVFRVNGVARQAYRRVRCSEWSSTDPFGSKLEELHALVLDDDQYQRATHAASEGWARWKQDAYR